MQETFAQSGAILVWQDLTKLGKVTGKELNVYTDVLATLLRQKPCFTAAFVTCPVLVSEKVSNNMRDEMRRFEDKFDAKGLANYMMTLRMEIPPSSKRVPLVFHGWLVIDSSSEADGMNSARNIFLDSQLMMDRRGKTVFKVNCLFRSNDTDLH